MDGNLLKNKIRYILVDVGWIHQCWMRKKKSSEILFCGWIHQCWMRKRKAHKYFLWVNPSVKEKKLGNNLWMDPSALDEKEKSSKILFCGLIHQCWTRKKKSS